TNIFLTMKANGWSPVRQNLFEGEVRRQEEIEAKEREPERRNQAELEQAVARHVGDPTSQPPSPAPAEQLDTLRRNASVSPPVRRAEPKIGRNDLCPCGSGKEFKTCHGAAVDEDEPPRAGV